MQVFINIDVAEMESAIRFYRQAFDLKLKRRLFDNSVAELTGTTAMIYLLEKKAGSAALEGMHEVRRYARHWTPVHLDFVVDDVDTSVQKAVAAGAVPETSIRSEAWGRIATLSDPFGNGFCILELTDRGYDTMISLSTKI